MLNIHRCFSFKIISIIFLFFSFANGQETNEVLHDLTISLDGLKGDSFISDIDNTTVFFGLLREIKEDLNSEKNKLEEFESSFCRLCDLLNQSDFSKEEKLEGLKTNVQDLNNLLDSSNFLTDLDEELKNKIILLGDLIRLFVNSEEVELDKLDQNFQSVSQAIEAISQFLNSDIYNQKNNQKIENNNNLDQQMINNTCVDNAGVDNIGVDNIGVDNIGVDNTFSEDKISNEKIVDFEVGSINEKLIENNKRQEPKARRVVGLNIQKFKNAAGVVSEAFRSIGDYRLGGYPIQFVHQLLRHMDKVYN